MLFFSCTQTKRTSATEEVIDSITLNSYRIINPVKTTLIPSAKIALNSWKEYQDVDEFLLGFYNISVTEALSKASELSNLVALMKDSIRVENLNKFNVIARFNVLHNETLRLSDMANISSISDDEVADEVKEILEIYAAVNDKINTIYKAQDIQNSLEVDTEKPIEIEEEKDEESEIILPKPKARTSVKND